MAYVTRGPRRLPAGVGRQLVLLLAGLCLAPANACLGTDPSETGLADGGAPDPGRDPTGDLNPGAAPQMPGDGNASTVAPGAVPAASNANLAVPKAVVADRPTGPVYLASLFDGRSCFDVHRVGATYDVNLYACRKDYGGQQWNVRANGEVAWLDDANLCLSLSTAATAATVPLTLARCANETAQKWTVSGTSLRHNDSARCLEFGKNGVTEPDGVGMGGIGLVACDAGSRYQRWSIGTYDALQKQFTAQQSKSTVQDKCSPELFISPYSTSDAGAKRVVGRYGSDAKLLAFVRQALLENCNAMFLAADEVPLIRSLGIVFDTECTGGAYTFGGLPQPSVYICSKSFQTIDEKEMPLTLRIDAMLHHELTHDFDVGYNKPSGIKEGYANLIVYRTNYLYNNKRVKGGSWADGYSTTAFFLLWLDEGFARKNIGQRFTDVMQKRAREHDAAQDDPNWFLPWVKQETGFTIDQLWTKYQASF